MSAPPVSAPPVAPSPVSRDLCVTFGRNFRAARLRRGLRQSDLADRMGLTPLRLLLIEGGHLTITLATMAELAQLVGLAPNAMLRLGKRHFERRRRRQVGFSPPTRIAAARPSEPRRDHDGSAGPRTWHAA